MAFVSPRYRNYTTTASFANALTVPSGDLCTAFSAVNETGEAVELTLDNSNSVEYYLPSGCAIVVDNGIEIKSNLRARYASGGSGNDGLHLTIWG